MENKNSSNFLNGFLLGALIGAGAVFLLGTKKGKQLLKSLSEDGLESITDILDQSSFAEAMEDEAGDEGVPEKGEMRYPTQKSPKKPLIRRFFRRSKTP